MCAAVLGHFQFRLNLVFVCFRENIQCFIQFSCSMHSKNLSSYFCNCNVNSNKTKQNKTTQNIMWVWVRVSHTDGIHRHHARTNHAQTTQTTHRHHAHTDALFAKMCRRNDLTSRTAYRLLSQGYLRQCLFRLLSSSCSHAVDSGTHLSWLWDVPRIQAIAEQPRTAWAFADFCVFGSPCREPTLLLVGNVDNRDLHRMARKCSGTSGRCSVDKHMFIQRLPHRGQRFIFGLTTPALPVYLSRTSTQKKLACFGLTHAPFPASTAGLSAIRQHGKSPLPRAGEATQIMKLKT